LNDRERSFVVAYCGDAHGNASKAAELAGYSKKAAGQIGYRLLKKAQIRSAIDQHVEVREQASILSAQQRDEILSQIASSSKVGEAARIKAIAELNKCSGRHTVKHEVEHSGGVELSWQ
jgi:phage terminase small subunit